MIYTIIFTTLVIFLLAVLSYSKEKRIIGGSILEYGKKQYGGFYQTRYVINRRYIYTGSFLFGLVKAGTWESPHLETKEQKLKAIKSAEDSLEGFYLKYEDAFDALGEELTDENFRDKPEYLI